MPVGTIYTSENGALTLLGGDTAIRYAGDYKDNGIGFVRYIDMQRALNEMTEIK